MRKKITQSLQANKLLLLIILLAAVLRFIFPDTPPSLTWDEVSHGYNAYSILKTGKDEWGKLFPIIFRAYGDYKLPVYIYLTSLSEVFFGLNTFAVRLPSVLAGIGIVYFSYLLAMQLFSSHSKDAKIALITALLVAVEPWSFFVSRAAFEANMALFLFVSGLYLFLKGISTINPKLLLYSAFLSGLTVWTYNSFRVFTPIMDIVVIFIFRKNIRDVYKRSKKMIYYSLIISAVFLLPMFYQLFSSVGQARYSWVQVLDQGAIAKIDEARGAGGNRLVHNKVTYFAKSFAENYVSHFSYAYLFDKGGSNYQFSIPGKGLLYLADIPFLIFGLVLLVKGLFNKEKWSYVLFFWLVLAPIPSSLTREAPHVLRSITFIPLPMLVTSLGVVELFSMVTGGVRMFLYTTSVLILSLLVFQYNFSYFNNYRIKYSQSWQFGYASVSEFIKINYLKYDKIVMTKKYGEPHEFLLFYLKWPSAKYFNDEKLNRFYQTNWYWVDGFDKFYFVNDWQVVGKELDNYTFKQESRGLVNCTPETLKCLLVTSPGNVPKGWKMVRQINFLDGNPAFELYEN